MTTPSETPAAPLFDLQRLFVTIRRRKRFWLATALLGLIAGAAVAVLLPAPPTAVTKVIVVHQEDSPTDSGTLMRTDVAVLQTTQIAEGALKKLGSTQAPEEFMKNYAGLGLTNNVLQITVKAKNGADAVAQAKALAETFIADHVQRSQAAAAAQSKAILDQRKNAQDELAKVDQEIADETAKGRNANASTLEGLYGRRAALASQISDFDARAQQAGIGSPQVAAGTQVVDAARLLPKAFLKTTATDAGIGFALGLALGIALVAIGAVSRDRPVLRREISTHLGASVIAQLPSKRRGLARVWRRSRVVSERERVATTLVRAIKKDSLGVSLLELGAPKVAAALALDVAGGLAADGRASVVDDLPREDVRKLAAETHSEVVVIGAGDPGPEPDEHRVGVGTVSPGTAWTDLEHLGSETVLVVKAGHANTLWLHTVARQLADQSIPVIGIVLVDPDPRDKSDGTLWDGLHTALRGRAKQAPAVQAAPAPHEDRMDELVARIAERVAVAEPPTRRFTPVRPVIPPALATPRPPTAPLPPPGTVGIPDHLNAPTKKFAPVKPPKRPVPFKRDHAEPTHKGELNAELEPEKSTVTTGASPQAGGSATQAPEKSA
ncbi:exopolysaccharide biosynthesis protein [Amycolatopsis balhimycina DSM 5908]|uniref:Exopolysaccharide biosynthesis protein n=1 Tax=Amycolatopsis balhimycina DSM 5908 TaxID=1081091 RepID=A0A428X458_AMYBA|nr:Wzz/FepE/Etk N-terminal domain-containing protein [Amycolatopsis balhimycina]RSM50108.1 exopolysaccharide biosynthesis protein [Amycolatopsis balhimycina DSM 5908]